MDNLKESVMFTYSTKELTRTEKVKFHYALKGRNGNIGFLRKVDGSHIGGAVIIVPQEFEEHTMQFFAEWSIPYEKHSIILKDEKKEKKTKR